MSSPTNIICLLVGKVIFLFAYFSISPAYHSQSIRALLAPFREFDILKSDRFRYCTDAAISLLFVMTVLIAIPTAFKAPIEFAYKPGFNKCDMSFNDDIGGTGIMIALGLQIAVTIIVALVGLVAQDSGAPKEMGGGLLLTHISLTIAVLHNLQRKSLEPLDGILGAIVLDMQNLALPIHFSAKETLAARVQVYTVLLLSGVCLISLGALMFFINQADGIPEYPCGCFSIYWWSPVSTCGENRVSKLWWVYYAYRLFSFGIVVADANENTWAYHRMEKAPEDWCKHNGTRPEGFLFFFDHMVLALANFATVTRIIQRPDVSQSSTIYSIGQIGAMVVAGGTVMRSFWTLFFRISKIKPGVQGNWDLASGPPAKGLGKKIKWLFSWQRLRTHFYPTKWNRYRGDLEFYRNMPREHFKGEYEFRLQDVPIGNLLALSEGISSIFHKERRPTLSAESDPPTGSRVGEPDSPTSPISQASERGAEFELVDVALTPRLGLTHLEWMFGRIVTDPTRPFDVFFPPGARPENVSDEVPIRSQVARAIVKKKVTSTPGRAPRRNRNWLVKTARQVSRVNKLPPESGFWKVTSLTGSRGPCVAELDEDHTFRTRLREFLFKHSDKQLFMFVGFFVQYQRDCKDTARLAPGHPIPRRDGPILPLHNTTNSSAPANTMPQAPDEVDLPLDQHDLQHRLRLAVVGRYLKIEKGASSEVWDRLMTYTRKHNRKFGLKDGVPLYIDFDKKREAIITLHGNENQLQHLERPGPRILLFTIDYLKKLVSNSST